VLSLLEMGKLAHYFVLFMGTKNDYHFEYYISTNIVANAHANLLFVNVAI